ncbi:polysaccharide biosynthesis C-terminal domain-containing protein [Acinetobacter baumannii]|nr:polysaccharide biosynthesis C-terminal domain-containing protein [Acinetobacter baumannii]
MLEQASRFLEIRWLSAPASLANLVLLGWLLGVQYARAPVILLVVGNLLNIVLDLWLVMGLRMNVQGAALATVTAEYATLIIGLLMAKQDNQHPGAQRRGQRLHQRPRQALRIFGAPGLSGEPGGAHAQEQQQHEEKTGGRRPARSAAEVSRAVQVADHRRIHQPQQRDGDVGENHREGKTPQRFIGSVEQHV